MSKFRVAFQVILFREVTWTLASPILEQLQSLTIPISDIKRYLGVVKRLGKLEHVRLHLDEPFEYFPQDYQLDDNPAEMAIWKAGRVRKEETCSDIVRFFETHTRLFPGRLKSIDCPETYTWPSIRQSLPTRTRAQLIATLPAIRDPTVINGSNWAHFLATHASANLSFVREIDVPLLLGVHARERLLEDRDVLRRCRTLKKMSIGSLGPGGLQWAVEEKKASMSRTNGSEDPSSLFQQNGMVPLEEITISDSTIIPFTDDDIDDLAFSFSSTLKRLFVRSHCHPFNPPSVSSPPRSLRIGHRWIELPVLTELVISLGNTHPNFDAGFLVHFPGIVSLTIHDWTFRYQPQDLHQEGASSGLLLPAVLPRLEQFAISGWTALRFHPDTFHSTSSLKVLFIGMRVGDNGECHIPPPPPIPSLPSSNKNSNSDGDDDDDDDQYDIPVDRWTRWTWNWDLPHLTQLSLTSEFAYKFQFRMLFKCPTLEELGLNIYTGPNPQPHHIRVITKSDLFLPDPEPEAGQQHQIQQQRSQRIVAPSLITVRMSSAWSVEAPPQDTLPEFLSGMLPNLLHFKAAHWSDGVPMIAFLDTLRRHASDGFNPYHLTFDDDALGTRPEGEGVEDEVWREKERAWLGLIPR